ncbi:MAG TPA: zonular occludens toxin domain-containing protein [Patescibacteria group bacterium]|nr:zonular occludens toxin domain-containing protein [Patescibacteria group bacterium]
MALLLYTGVAGTGKTLYAIQKYIIPELSKGNQIYTNIDGIVLARISLLFDQDLIQLERGFHDLKDPGRFWEELKQNSMCVLDEAQNIFSNRNWQDRNNVDCVKYLMEHRHYGHQLVFISPHIDAMDAGIRRVAELTYKHKSFSIIGGAKTVKCAVFSQANINNEPLQTFTWKHDTRIYDCYKSYFLEGTVEKKVKVNIFRDPKLIFIVLVVIASSIWAISSFPKMSHRFFNKGHKISSSVKLNMPDIKSVRSQAIIINDSLLVGKDYRRVIR